MSFTRMARNLPISMQAGQTSTTKIARGLYQSAFTSTIAKENCN
jgi:hypothetical protein